MGESMKDYIQIGLHSLGISVIDDINREDLFYITINASKELWTETRNYSVNPIPQKMHQHLDQHYKTYLHDKEKSAHGQPLHHKYEIDKHRVRSIGQFFCSRKCHMFFLIEVCLIRW